MFNIIDKRSYTDRFNIVSSYRFLTKEIVRHSTQLLTSILVTTSTSKGFCYWNVMFWQEINNFSCARNVKTQKLQQETNFI